MKKWMLGAAMMAAVAMLTGCGGGPKTVKIEAQHMKFSKTEISLKAGETVKLLLVNKDTEIHDFTVDLIPVDVIAQTASPEAHTHSDEDEPDLHVAAAAGAKGWVEFTPMEPGTYTFYCSVSGHAGMGMEGRLIVK